MSVELPSPEPVGRHNRVRVVIIDLSVSSEHPSLRIAIRASGASGHELLVAEQAWEPWRPA